MNYSKVLLPLISFAIFSMNSFSGEKELFDNIKNNNNYSLKSVSIYPRITNLDNNTLKSFINKEKVVYSKFDLDLLYKFVARDEDYRYEFFFDYQKRECVFVKNKIDVYKASLSCVDKFNVCMATLTIDSVSSGDVKSCLSSPECKKMESLNKGKSIDIDICKKIYGRRL